MSQVAAKAVRKLGGRMSLTARQLQQERATNMRANAPKPLSTDDTSAHDAPAAKRSFDPWLRLGGTRNGNPHPIAQTSWGMFDFMGHQPWLKNYEQRSGNARRRALSDRDKESLVRSLEAVYTNLVFSALKNDDPPCIAVSLRSAKIGNTRYDRPGFSNIPKILEMFSQENTPLSSSGLPYVGLSAPWRLYKSRRKGVPSVVVGTDSIKSYAKNDMKLYEHTIADFYREPGFETIILTRSTRNHYDGGRSREWIDYAETPQSILFREQMVQINEHLRSASITFSEAGNPPAIGFKELRRYFSLLEEDPEDAPRFDQGGRLFGAWWQDLDKRRRHAIRINGEPVADLDFSNMFLRLAYLDTGLEPPTGDLYAVIPGLSEPFWRDGVKVLVNAMLFRTTPMQRLPRDPELKRNLPPGAKGSVMRQAILAGHPNLQGTFETGAGYRLMFVESQILISAILRMIKAGITPLAMHDGCMVPRSQHEAAADCMAQASEEITGFRLPISLKSMYN